MPLWSMGAAKDQTPPHSAQAEEFQFLRFGNPSALLHLLERTVELPLARVQPLL